MTETLFNWQAERDAALATVERNAGKEFGDKARAFVIDYLRANGPTSCEEITYACKGAGIVPENSDRAFGSVYRSLAFRGVIESAGMTIRKRGHGVLGATIWRLKP